MRSISDYYEGQPAGTCECGASLVRAVAHGIWVVTHSGPSACPLISTDQLQPISSDDS